MIVPVRNAILYLPAVIPALSREVERYGDAELIVVESCSTDDSLAWLRARGGLRLLENVPGRVGAVRNAGAAAATGDVLSFVDADCEPLPGLLGQVAEALERTGASACGSPYDLPLAPSWVEATWQGLHEPGRDGWVTYLPAGNFHVRREAFALAGGFREDLSSGEDAELGQRMTRAGLKTWNERRIAVRHLGNPKTLRSFFRKQRWHGAGMFGTVTWGAIDLPVVNTFLHLVFLVATVPVALLVRPPIGLALALLLPWIIPIAAVAYRSLQIRNVWRPLRSILLYQLYFLARLTALRDIVVGREHREARA